MQRRQFAATLAGSAALGANDRIQLGVIGCGGIGTYHLRKFVKHPGVRVVAVSDVYTARKDRARAITSLAGKDIHHEYRDLLARPDVEAVLIATPDHWHGRMALNAIRAGKDVYLQKPMTYTIEEAQAIVAAAREHARIVQVGSQWLSDPRVHIAREAIAAGEIGPLLWGQATASRNSRSGEWNDRIEPEGNTSTIDWGRWLGPAPKRPFSAERYFRWRKYWDYSGGIATDLFYHRLAPVLYAMGGQYPVSVSGSGGIYIWRDREVPDTCSATIEYPGFYITLSGSMANAAPNRYLPMVIYGRKGSVVFEKNQILVVPEMLDTKGMGRPRAGDALNYARVMDTPPDADPHDLHTNNWLECLRSRRSPHLPPELGAQTMTAIRLAVDSYREGRTKYFDPATQQVVDRPPRRPAFEGTGA